MSAKQRQIPLLAIVLLIVILLPACGPRQFCDCSWSGSVTTWFDANGNSLKEKNEPPLAGVKIISNYLYSDTTNPNGKADFDIWAPGCPCKQSFDLRFKAEPPMGYRLTTPNEVDIYHGEPEFGFELNPVSATKTPNPIALKCISYYGEPYLGDPSVTDLGIDNTGHVWVSTQGGGVSEFIPAQDIWHRYIQNPYTYSIALSQTGSVWMGGSEDVTIWNGTILKHLESGCPSQIANINDITFDEHGAAWFGTPNGALTIDLQTKECTIVTCSSWKDSPSKDGGGQNSVEKITVTSDGSIWALTFLNMLSRVGPLLDSTSSGDCLTYSPYSDPSDEHHLTFRPYAISPEKGGGLWMTGENTIAHLETLTGQLTPYVPVEQLADSYFKDLVVYPDGSLLIGTTSQGLLRYWPENGASEVTPPMIFDSTDGISNNDIQAITVNEDGSIWIGTRNGLSHCSFQDP